MRAPPDGYTLLLVDSTASINATLYEKLNYNFIRDIAPVAGIVRLPLVMVVHPSVPAKTVPEFIACAKANPGKLTMASGGNGSPAHVAGELFKMMAGVDMVHVPYRGLAPALTDLLGGQVRQLIGTVSARPRINCFRCSLPKLRMKELVGTGQPISRRYPGEPWRQVHSKPKMRPRKMPWKRSAEMKS